MSLMGRVLNTLSGGTQEKLSEQLLFDKVIGFRGVRTGVGCSTLVMNLACGLIDATKYTVCVVDTNLLYPSQEFMLSAADSEEQFDILDFTGENIADLAYKTKYTNVYLVSFRNRLIADLLSSKDCQATMDKLMETLKQFFDIILVDLSHEPSWATTVAALKCNRIYSIVTPDVLCLSILQKSINSLASTGIPTYKLRKVILNKNIAEVNTNVYKTLKDLEFEVIGDIPFSVDIAKYNLIGDRIWGALSNRPAVTKFNQVVDRLMDDICQSNELNAKNIKSKNEYVDMSQLEQDPNTAVGMFDDIPKNTGRKVKGFGKKKQAATEEPDLFAEDTSAPIMPQLTKDPQPVRRKGSISEGMKRRAQQVPTQPKPQAVSEPVTDDEEIDLFGGE